MVSSSGESDVSISHNVSKLMEKGSHGRDNKVRMYERLRLSCRLGQAGEKETGLPILREIDVNALNFCRFAIASLEGIPSSGDKGKGRGQEGVLIVPSLLDSECVSDDACGAVF